MDVSFHERLRSVRLEKGLTQKQLGERCGIADPTIRKYESGKLNPKLETVKKLADGLQVDYSYLLGWNRLEKRLAEEVRFMEQAEKIGGNVYRVNHAFEQLNETGQEKVIAYAEDLLQITVYCQDKGLTEE